MKILSIGNSFSQDAQRYLYRLAKKAGDTFKTVNLDIGGCSLRRHYLNSLEDTADYAFEYNGDYPGLTVSIKQLLISDDWNVITLQQASHLSAHYETYTPYLENLVEYIKKYCPHSKIYMHQTWAYEDGSERLRDVGGYDSADAMFNDIREAYAKAAQAIQADGIIPCGKAMLNATKMGMEKIHRDTFHASLGAGRYLLALVWYKTFTGKDITNDTFDDFDEPVSEEERKIVINAVNAAFNA